MLNDTELIGNEITYLRPGKSKLKTAVEAIIAAAAIIFFLKVLLIFAAVSY
jgi:hypothetical protein